MTKGLCVYCGESLGTTKDHVIPRQFFTEVPQDIILVPCCKACNSSKQKGDEYMRQVLVSEYTTSQHPTAIEILDSKLLRAARRNRTPLLADVADKSIWALISDPSSNRLIPAALVNIDRELILKYIETVTRGLHFHEYGCRLSHLTELMVVSRSTAETAAVITGLGRDRVDRARVLGRKNEFSYLVWHVAESDKKLWLLSFYEGIHFVVFHPKQEFLKDIQIG